MKYTVKLSYADSSEFPQWTAVDMDLWLRQSEVRYDPDDQLGVFDSYKDAEQFARELDNVAWERWEAEARRRLPPESVEIPKNVLNWATEHAPCFTVEEIEE